mmetsp:Transcript_35322/g.42525  ORF Transcript_35322/g.42525 Transcript_35322/m.42525 type:complete len:824 (+) Transcript_35322:131-2602(+)|eukprot:CAMPEP_0197845524 /NCGR_PEP_ID=MMETSP1438-20131217/2442_1 /TAXON_ID=1461541 /ORGANISM="Pterosperma sp., Strain CCMP1384" /LENGTH=823 /DNA_ID=CAMNT_0043456849 /DNA_START=127 /DNA_END=2598 /DNA_ORIENTATION=+
MAAVVVAALNAKAERNYQRMEEEAMFESQRQLRASRAELKKAMADILGEDHAKEASSAAYELHEEQMKRRRSSASSMPVSSEHNSSGEHKSSAKAKLTRTVSHGISRHSRRAKLSCLSEADVSRMTPKEIAYRKYEYQFRNQPISNCCGWEAPMKYRKPVYVLYNGDTIQLIVAFLIMVNFLVNAAEAQVKNQPLKPGQIEPDKEGQPIFNAFEMFFTIIFTVELAANMYAHWWREFWFSGWNLFDFVVVVVSLLTLTFSNMPGTKTLRLLRAFRVFRLFKRLESLRKILKALENAVPGCMNAFCIVVLVNAIYSILGVEFFKDNEEAGKYFKNFSVAMFTMFQVMTGDSWAEAVARPIIDTYPHAAIFFVSYIILVGIVLVNVVIAVLLEKMVDSGDDEDDIEENRDAWMLGGTSSEEDEAETQRSPLSNENSVQKRLSHREDSSSDWVGKQVLNNGNETKPPENGGTENGPPHMEDSTGGLSSGDNTPRTEVPAAVGPSLAKPSLGTIVTPGGSQQIPPLGTKDIPGIPLHHSAESLKFAELAPLPTDSLPSSSRMQLQGGSSFRKASLSGVPTLMSTPHSTPRDSEQASISTADQAPSVQMMQKPTTPRTPKPENQGMESPKLNNLKDVRSPESPAPASTEPRQPRQFTKRRETNLVHDRARRRSTMDFLIPLAQSRLLKDVRRSDRATKDTKLTRLTQTHSRKSYSSAFFGGLKGKRAIVQPMEDKNHDVIMQSHLILNLIQKVDALTQSGVERDKMIQNLLSKEAAREKRHPSPVKKDEFEVEGVKYVTVPAELPNVTSLEDAKGLLAQYGINLKLSS